MKKRFVTPLIALLFAFVITPLDAQMISAPNSKSTSNAMPIGNTNLNLRFGINVSSLVVNEDDPNSLVDLYHGRLGFHLGINTFLPINSKSGLDVSILYSQRGSNINHSENSNGINIGIEGLVKINYLEIPLFYSYQLPIRGKKLNLMVGPTIGIGLGGKYDVEFIFGTSRTTEKLDVKFKEPGINDISFAMKRLDLGLNLGASTQVKNIVVGLNYNIGLIVIKT
jgi:hypothetical protein